MGFMSGRGPLSRGPSAGSAFSVSVLMTRGKVLRPSPSHRGKAADNLRPKFPEHLLRQILCLGIGRKSLSPRQRKRRTNSSRGEL